MRKTLTSFLLSAAITAALPGAMLMAQTQSDAGQSAPAMSGRTQAAGVKTHRNADPKKQARLMARKLGLSSEQTTKLEPILVERQQQMESVRADTSMAARDMHAKMRTIHQESDQKIEAILNDGQKQQYEQMKQNRKKHRSEGASSPSGV